MTGMGQGLKSNNPTITTAFRSALDHQFLIVVIVAVVLALAWNVIRTLNYRRAVAAGTLEEKVPDPWPYPEPPARRVLRLGFGILWLFDGLLQVQSSMPVGLPSQVITPAAATSPGWVQHLVNVGTTIWTDHPVSAAAATVWIQVGIGLFLLVAPRGYWSRSAGVVSAGWGVLVWVFGEAFGGIFAPGASWLFGSPGAAVFYVVAGVLVALRDSSWETPELGRWLLRAVGAFFIGMGVLQAWPGRGFWSGQTHPGGVPGTLTTMVDQMGQVSQPSLFSSWVRSFASFEATHGWAVNFVVVVALIGIGACFVSGRTRLLRAGVIAGAVLCLANWILVQDFGFFGGVGTDPNSMIPMAVVFTAGYVAVVRVPARAESPVPSVRPAPSFRRVLRPSQPLLSVALAGRHRSGGGGARRRRPDGPGLGQPQCRCHRHRGEQRDSQRRRRPGAAVHAHRPGGQAGLAAVARRPYRGAHLPRPGLHLGLPAHRPGAAGDRPDARLQGGRCRPGRRGGQPPLHQHRGHARLRQAGRTRPPAQLDLSDRVGRASSTTSGTPTGSRWP